MFDKVTRLEIIDHRKASIEAGEGGRKFSAHNCGLELFVQDDGRTLKIFVDDSTDAKRSPARVRDRFNAR